MRTHESELAILGDRKVDELDVFGIEIHRRTTAAARARLSAREGIDDAGVRVCLKSWNVLSRIATGEQAGVNGITVVLDLVAADGDAEILDDRLHLELSGILHGLGELRKREAAEDGDDRDHDQQLNEREGLREEVLGAFEFHDRCGLSVCMRRTRGIGTRPGLR